MSFERRPSAPSWIPHGYGMRLVIMLAVLVLIGVTIYNLSRQSRRSGAPRRSSLAFDETVVPGPSDGDKVEHNEGGRDLNRVLDAEPLVSTDMPAYWRLVKWSRAQSFAELEKRARPDNYVALWQEPEKHRGELVRLDLHVHRAMKWGAAENSDGVEKVYDISGSTDKSVGNPYVVVATEIPKEFPLDVNVRAEAVFVGYFLKIVKYPAGDGLRRGAPLLIGRIRLANVPQPADVKLAAAKGHKSGNAGNGGEVAAPSTSWLITGGAIAALALVLMASWALRLTRRTRPAVSLSKLPTRSAVDVESWLERFPTQAADETHSEQRARAESNGASGNGVHPARPGEPGA